MQIQRIQTLWLLMGAACAVASIFMPWFSVGGEQYVMYSDVPLLVVGILAALLPFIGIFLFKNTRRQKLTARLGALFALLALGYAVSLTLVNPADVKICVAAPVCMAFSGAFDCLAIKGIVHDEKLLKAADRLR